MVGESNQNVFLIQKDALSFAEFEISEFEIARFDCITSLLFSNKSSSVSVIKFNWKSVIVNNIIKS